MSHAAPATPAGDGANTLRAARSPTRGTISGRPVRLADGGAGHSTPVRDAAAAAVTDEQLVAIVVSTPRSGAGRRSHRLEVAQLDGRATLPELEAVVDAYA